MTNRHIDTPLHHVFCTKLPAYTYNLFKTFIADGKVKGKNSIKSHENKLYFGLATISTYSFHLTRID